ncbi:MAG: ribosomal L7Ae/L30e/S12e/Gadd45 family protein [Oscillospiraceae bacterium]|nr:ribosomal L7Ae/L30e/S12e/Gadd45 family protein [Oscillospiraceae bacterium]
MRNLCGLLGIAKKAGRLEIGEEPVGAVARARKAKLILLASDAADNSARRAARFAQAGAVPCVRVPLTKAELGGSLGRASCAMLAITDTGFAAAVAGQLAAADGAEYGALAETLGGSAEREKRRRQEQLRHEKNRKKAKPWAPPPEKSAQPRQPTAARAKVPRGVVRIKRNDVS